MRFVFALISLCAGLAAQAQTPNNIEAVEYDPDGNRWFVSNGSSLLVTEDQVRRGHSLVKRWLHMAWR